MYFTKENMNHTRNYMSVNSSYCKFWFIKLIYNKGSKLNSTPLHLIGLRLSGISSWE